MLNGGRSGYEFDSLPASDIALLTAYYFAKINRKLSLVGKMLGGGKTHGRQRKNL